MAWPTVAEAKAQFAKLNESAYDGKLAGAVAFASSRVLGAARAAGYDVTGFASTTPALAYHIAMFLVYGYFAPRVHTGSGMTASDEAAKDARDYAEDLLKKLVDGEIQLTDTVGEAVTTLGSGIGHVHRRTDGPVFTPGEPETWAVTLLVPGSEMI